MNVIILIAGIALLTVDGQLDTMVFNFIIFVAVAITAITVSHDVLAFKKTWMLKVIDWATNIVNKITRGKWGLGKFKDEAIEITDHFHDSMTEYRHNLKPVAESLLYLGSNMVF